MPAVHLNHVSFRHTSAVEVLSDVDVHLGPGWTGVVGANGSGKTTLLNLVAGSLIPTAGEVLVEPSDGVVVLCPQSVEDVTPAIEDFAASWDRPDVSLRARLSLDPVDLNRWGTLSPGERKRWQVGAALVARPDVLLLDEPTNHLDAEARDILAVVLARFEGVGLLVSHDRALLEELTQRTLRVDRGRVTTWGGPYRVAREAWEAEEAGHVAEYERLKRRRQTAERRVADQRRVQEQKRAAFRRRNNTASFKDIDARSAARGGKHREGEKAAGAVLATATRDAERAAGEVAAMEMRKEVGGDVFVDYAPAPKRLLASHVGPLHAGSHLVAGHIDIGVERDSRVWLRGGNGAGKTTLLQALVAGSGLPPERVLFVEQDLTAAGSAAVMQEMRNLAPAHRGRVLSLVAALGVDPDVLLASDNPSPGEVRKLAMALGLGRQAWLVALDEPTNHLDLPSIERLERALSAYPGALLVVTHDEDFAAALGLQAYDLTLSRVRPNREQ